MTTDSKGPFASAAQLATWSAEILQSRGIDAIADWRMLEYWMQVELFRAVRLKKAAEWRHLGDYEQPYVTRIPGAKSETKWVDLLFGREIGGVLDRLLWIELKDIGRDARTVAANARGVGRDLAALWSIDKVATLEQWRTPPPRAVDRGRLEQWQELAGTTASADWWIGQVVLVPMRGFESVTDTQVQRPWLEEFENRVKRSAGVAPPRPVIARAETREFIVYALVERASLIPVAS